MERGIKVYNQDQKNNYIETKKHIKGFAKNIMSIFTKCEELENKYEKDCSEFNIFEIKEIFLRMNTISLSGLYNYNCLLRCYTDWCIRQKLTSTQKNYYTKINKNTLCCLIDQKAKNERRLSREELLNEIKKIPNVCDQFLALAIFEGIGERNSFADDFCELSLANFDGNKVHLKNRTLDVSDESIELAQKSSEEYNKYDSKGNLMQRGFKENDKRILKDSLNTAYDDKEHKRRNIALRLMRLENEFGPAFRYGALRDSGEIDLLKSFMRVDNNNDIYEAYLNHQEEYDNRYGKPQPDQLKDEMYLRYADMITA